jgi:hypothetical protein
MISHLFDKCLVILFYKVIICPLSKRAVVYLLFALFLFCFFIYIIKKSYILRGEI